MNSIALISNVAKQNCSGPLLLKAEEVAALCSVSVRTWRTWDSAGYIPGPICIGRSKLWNKAEFFAWYEAGCPGREAWGKSPENPRRYSLRKRQA